MEKAGTGSSRKSDATSAPADLRALTRQIQFQEETLRQGGGPSGWDRQHKLGRLQARERIGRLIDTKSFFLEIQLWAAYEMYQDVGGAVSAGVVTGIGYVHDRACMIVANDATVKAGAFFPATAKKVLRAQRIAMRCNLPLLYLVDSAGVFLPMQDEIFPDEDDFGRIFRNNAVISAMGIPQIAAIMGNCVAGGAYLPVLCDKILMTAGSEMYLAGPALVKASIGQQVDGEDLGGAKMHAEVSGTVDFYEKSDEDCLDRLRALVDLLPMHANPLPKRERLSQPRTEDRGTQSEGILKNRGDQNNSAASKPSDTLNDLIDINHPKEYNALDLIKTIVDPDSLHEYKSDYGKSLVCAYASIDGRKIGIVANQRIRTKSPKGELQIGGVIYHDSADKAARFVLDCNQTQLPIVFLQDVQGFMVGRDSEQAGIIRCGAKLVNAVSNSTVPKITVIVGGSFGAGNYALCGKAFDPSFIFAWPNAKYAVMGADQAAGTLLQLQQRQAERLGKNSSQLDIDELRDRIKGDYLKKTDIRYGAARGWVDAIIAPEQTREVLIHALDFSCRAAPVSGVRTGVFQV